MITKEQADKIIEEKLLNFREMSIEEITKTIQEHMRYLMQNYKDLDGPLVELCDKYSDNIFKTAEKNISKMPEGIEKIKAQRILKRKDNLNFDAGMLVEILERRNSDDNELLVDTRDIFISNLQSILDFLSDIVSHQHKGIHSFAILSLFYLSVDELLSGFHLCQHNYVNQAYSHIRSVVEILDKIELFIKEPRWAELWISEEKEDKEKARFELSPSGVRKKLGRNSFDPIYGLLSELGPHGAFKGIKNRTIMEDLSSEEITARLWIGGCPIEHNKIFINSFLIKVMGEVLFEITENFKEYLNEAEVEDAIISLAKNTKKFAEKHFIPFGNEEGFDLCEMVELLKREL